MIKEPFGYLGGDIMTFGSNLAREYEYEKFKAAGIPGEVYSPVQNKSINDKSNMTEEENNHLAEKICEADIERLWNSDYTVLCPEQSAIGTMCEMGVLYGWKYMADKLMKTVEYGLEQEYPQEVILDALVDVIKDIQSKKNYAHYFDIRTNHLNEKDWRRSFSINQMLYGMILYATEDHMLHNSFDEILPLLKKEFGEKRMTWKEFNKPLPMEDNPRYQKTDIECPECKKLIYKDVSMVLTSDPPQYRYVCECGWSGSGYR